MTVCHHHIFSAETGYGSVPGRQSEFLATEKQRDPTTIVISLLDGVVGRRSDTNPVYPVLYTASGWSFHSGEDLRYREEFQIPPKQTELPKV